MSNKRPYHPRPDRGCGLKRLKHRTCQRIKDNSEGFREKCNQPTTRGRRYCFDCRVWYQQNGGLPSAGE